MSGVEAVLIGCVSVNTAINVGQSSGMFAWIRRKFRLFNSRLVSVSCQSNPMISYCICKTLSAITKNEQIRTLITINVNEKSEVFYIPDFGAEVYITTKNGTLYIKPISLDGFNLTAFELSCWISEKDIIDIFMNNILKFYSNNFSSTTIEYFGNIIKNTTTENKKIDNIFSEIFNNSEKKIDSSEKKIMSNNVDTDKIKQSKSTSETTSTVATIINTVQNSEDNKSQIICSDGTQS